MSTNVSLPPALERFVRDSVEEGRYSNASEVVRSALRLLQQYEEERRAFIASVEAAQAEADRNGTFTTGEVAAEARELVRSRRRCQRRGSRRGRAESCLPPWIGSLRTT